MKVKRRILAILLSLTMIMSLSTVCQAAWGKVETKVIDIYLCGSISFVEGPLWITDKVNYSGWLQIFV